MVAKLSLHRGISSLCLLALLGCGKTAVFGVEPTGYDPEDAGLDAAIDPEDAPLDAGPDVGPDAAEPDFGTRPDFPDVGFPDLPCEGCDEITRILDGRRWELPCEDDGPTEITCRTESRRRQFTNLRGLPGSIYEVLLRFRGAVELHEYEGGYSEDEAWNTGGLPRASLSRNVFVLGLNDPAQTYYLNFGGEGPNTVAIDYQLPIRFSVGGQVEFRVESFDEVQTRNRDVAGRPIRVPGVEPFPESFDGQFIEMNVLSIRRIR